MNSILKHQIQMGIDSLNKNSFQDFIDQLLLIYYGTHNYLPTRQYRDKGCDGIINKNEVVGVYAPEKLDLVAFKKKFKSDYGLYTQHWQKTYPKFCYIINGEYTSDMIGIVDEFDKKITKWGQLTIINIIEELTWANVRKIANLLHIDEQFLIYDILKCVIDDLLKDIGETGTSGSTIPPNVVAKIQANYEENDVQNAISEYENALPTIVTLKSVLKAYQDSENRALKDKILTMYGKISGSFKERLNNLVNILALNSSGDELYAYHVKVVLLYYFEVCLIGNKV